MSYTDANSSRVVLEGQRPNVPVPHTSKVVLVALLVVAFFTSLLGTYAVLRYRAPRAIATPAVSSARVTSAVVDVSAGVPVDALPAPAVVPTTTRVTFSRSPISHRVWIDGVLVGDDREPITIKCGRHTIQIGSQGKPRAIDLPCGGETALP